MAQVHAVAAGSTAGVEVERLALFVAVEDQVEFAVGEKGASAEQRVCSSTCELLKAREQGLVNVARPELIDELVIVDGDLVAAEDEPMKT